MTSDERDKEAAEVGGEQSEGALADDGEERRDPGQGQAEALPDDDEGPPSVPDISEPDEVKATSAEATPPAEPESPSSPESIPSRRLAPPPKPTGRSQKMAAVVADESPQPSVVDKAPPKDLPKASGADASEGAEELDETDADRIREVEADAERAKAEPAGAAPAAGPGASAESPTETEPVQEVAPEEVEDDEEAALAEEVAQEELVDEAAAEAAEEVDAVQLDVVAPDEGAGEIKAPPRSIPIPDDEVPEKAAPESIKAVMAMRIISVGVAKDDDEAPPEILEDLDVVSVGPAKAATLDADELRELPDEDVASDSSPQATAEVEELAPEDASRVDSAPDAAPVKPPPPPRRTPPPPAAKRAAKKKAKPEKTPAQPQRRPWWEEVFCEDFTRAHARPKIRQIVREVDFIEKSLGIAPGAVVLDLGCGEGYHAVEMSSRGYGVVGYDLSLFQLALAADVAQERGEKINFLQGDMREMAFEEMFDGIYCWNTTFGYFEEEKNIAVAERMLKALRPGGSLLLDVANRDFIVVNQPSSVWYEGDSCVCMDEMSVDFITSRMKVKRSLILDDGRTCETYYSIRLYSLHELGKLLHDVGFRVVQASGDPVTPGEFFGERSPRIIVLAQKP